MNSDFNKIKSIFLYIFFFILLIPIFSINAIESNSNNYILNDYDFDTGNNINSTNFSISGNISQGSKGSFVSSSLPLIPGNITSCGKITTSGTYTLINNIIGIKGTCFNIQANNVIINGAGYSITASSSNNSYAITATSTNIAGSGYGTTTIQNITFSGFGGGINSSGNNASTGNTKGGNGGSIIVTNSSIGSILSNAGLGSGTGAIGDGANIIINNSITGNITNTGLSGSINIIGTNLDISNNTYTTSSSGTFSIQYSGTLTTSNTTLSSLQSFIIQNVNYGSYIGGAFPLFPSTINTCGNLYFPGTYTLSTNVTANCNILNTGITINGSGNTLTGNITANNHGVVLSNININGNVSTTGAGANALIVNNNSNLNGNISITGILSGDGSSSIGNTIINSGASVATSSVSFVGDVTNNGLINPGNTVLGKTINNSIINTLGNFSFNATSTNSGTVNGNAIFSASSTNSGTVTGYARFNALTSVNGSIYFSNSFSFSGIGYVGGNVYDSTGVNIIDTWNFNDSSSNTGVIKGNAFFYDSSINTITGIVTGNATFNNSSQNLGLVTGNSNVYLPVVRPLGGITNGQIIYHNYAGLYFNDNAVGHGVVGKWDDINNWWTDADSTIHSPVIPTEGDDVIILFGNITTSTISARVKSIIFQNNTNNNINITVLSTAKDAALFKDTSTNSGIITGNATFSGPDTENIGTVTGFITRLYDSGTYTVVKDFTHNSVYWIVKAINGATVDLTGSTYSLIENIFEALNNAVFIWNNLIGTGSPDLTITSPVSGTNIKWKPIISWGTSVLCQYKIDGGNYTSVNCANNGSDIPRPTAGSHTIFFRSSDGQNSTEKSITFTYDNTQPVDTDCTTPLDESTRPYYYLTSNVNSCNIVATTTLRGDNNGGGNYYTVVDLIGNGNPITLQNINSTGSISGFGNMTISSSTLNGDLTINGIFNTDTISTFGNTIVNNNAVVNGGNFTGNLVNNGTLINSTTTAITVLGNTTNNGIINNGFIFNASSTNAGTVNGTTTLNNFSVNTGTVNGNLIFNTLTSISNIVTFANNTNFLGTGNVTGNIFDNQGNIISNWLFKDNSTNIGNTKGNVFFNGNSINLGTITGDAHFSDSSTNSGTITGNAYKYNSYLIAHVLGGTVNGSINYYSYPNSVNFRNISGDNDWNNISNWFTFVSTTTPLGRLPISGENIVLFASTTLKNNINNDIYIAFSSTTLNGGGYTLSGNIKGNGAYGGFNAYDFNIENITVTGTTTAIGGDGNSNINGGNGGNIIVRDSSTYIISVSGGNSLLNGGNAGNVYVYKTIATQSNTSIKAIGGNSTGCGFGGSGGNIYLTDSSDYVLLVNPGINRTETIANGGSCANIPVGNSGVYGQTSVIGSYNNNTTNNNNNNNNNNTVNTNTVWFSSTVQKINKESQNLIPAVNFAIKLSKFKINPLPVFGDGLKNTFSFYRGIENFFLSSIPQDILINFKSTPNLLSSLNIKTINDLILIKNKSRVIDNTKVEGLFTIYSNLNTTPLKSYINFDGKKTLYQTVNVDPNIYINITLIPNTKNSKYRAVFNDKDIYFIDNKIVLKTPSVSGSYILTTNSTPVHLRLNVIDKKEKNNNFDIIKNNIINIFNKIIEYIKKIFIK